jgi:HIV Tat-specific factor 1
MSVKAAKFEQRGTEFDPKRSHVSEAKRKVAKLAALQAMDWDEGEFNGRLTGGRKGLRIVVLKGMFDAIGLGKLQERDEENVLHRLEQDLRNSCEEWGATIEKMTVFSKNKEGVVVLKFAQPGAASKVVKQMNGLTMDGRTVEASFWDGKTDFTVVDEEAVTKELEHRHEAFGDWLDSQDLPEELRLQSE